MSYHAGMQLRLTDGGDLLTIWSPAHLTGCYWAHLGEGPGPRRMVLIRVRQPHNAVHPVVTLVEDQ